MGKLRSDNGREWLPFTIRLYFYRSTPEMKMVYTMFYDGDQNADFIRSLGVRFDVPMRESLYNRHVAFSTGNGGVWSEPVQPLVGRRVLVLPGDTSKMSIQERQMLGERIPEYDAFDQKGHHPDRQLGFVGRFPSFTARPQRLHNPQAHPRHQSLDRNADRHTRRRLCFCRRCFRRPWHSAAGLLGVISLNPRGIGRNHPQGNSNRMALEP